MSKYSAIKYLLALKKTDKVFYGETDIPIARDCAILDIAMMDDELWGDGDISTTLDDLTLPQQ